MAQGGQWGRAPRTRSRGETPIITESYLKQQARWPREGRCILAHHDEESIVVYQAFRPEVADEAVRLQRFGAGFSRNRMSWIKPNFLWMMYRSGWATKPAQVAVLGVRLKREFFERALRLAVASSYDPHAFPDRSAWSAGVRTSEVRLQWDPDRDPEGSPCNRRALQLGLRGRMLSEYADGAILEIEDMNAVVERGRRCARAPFAGLEIPMEHEFLAHDPTQ